MVKPIERELKILLTKEQFEKILHSYDFPICIKQSNTYYDTKDQLVRKLPGAVRIREREGNHIFTMKIHNDETSNIELEKNVPVSELSKLEDPQIRQWLAEYNIPQDELQKTYSIHTTRHMIITKNAEICLDETNFGPATDYELEYEYKKEHDGISEFNQILKTIGLKFEKNCPSKLARAASYQNL